ncbi:MAG: HemK/PrmC family methyltransferase, partial [Candidatus Saccharimonadales bacterium]
MTEPSSMTVSEWLASSESNLKKAGIETARLDALVLLSDELQKDKSWLLAYSDYSLQGSELKKLNTKVAQRALHTPLAYIRGYVEFYGHEFVVSPAVLVPRPESESFFELLTSLEPTSYTSIIDVGTGRGALAISAALLAQPHDVFATDNSEGALAIAKFNAKEHAVTVTFAPGNLIEPISDTVLKDSVLLCNLPYVPIGYSVNKATTHEPDAALFSGAEGLDHYNALFQ